MTVIHETNTPLTWGSTADESTTISASRNSNPIRVARSATISGASSLDGNLKLQATLDVETNSGWEPTGVTGLSNWVDVADSSTDVTTDGTTLWNVARIGWRWVRLVYTSTAGTGTLVGRIQVKGE